MGKLPVSEGVLKGGVTIRCVILGGGGHAAVVIDAMLATRKVVPYGVLDADPIRWGKDILGVPIRGGDDRLPELISEGVTSFVVGLGGIRDNGPRQRLFERGLAAGLSAITVRHPSAVLLAQAKTGAGSVILASAVIGVGATLGMNVLVNTGVVVEHDCVIEDHAHLATGARLGGCVSVAKGAHVGIGATVCQGLTVGEGAVVGAGSVVIEKVEPWTVVAGVPARPIHERANS